MSVLAGTLGADGSAGNRRTKRKRKRFLASSFGIFGSPSWARTSDLRINSPSLYRLSYRGIKNTKYISSIRKKQGRDEK